jgi:hypothetical protein
MEGKEGTKINRDREQERKNVTKIHCFMLALPGIYMLQKIV